MKFFNRRTQPAGVQTTTAPETHREKTSRTMALGTAMNPVGTMNKRPPFGQWLKSTWIDILTMAILGAVGLGVSNWLLSLSSLFSLRLRKASRSSLTGDELMMTFSFRSIKPRLLPHVRSPSTLPTVRSCIRNSPIPCAMRSSPFGLLPCSQHWCRLPSF